MSQDTRESRIEESTIEAACRMARRERVRGVSLRPRPGTRESSMAPTPKPVIERLIAV